MFSKYLNPPAVETFPMIIRTRRSSFCHLALSWKFSYKRYESKSLLINPILSPWKRSKQFWRFRTMSGKHMTWLRKQSIPSHKWELKILRFRSEIPTKQKNTYASTKFIRRRVFGIWSRIIGVAPNGKNDNLFDQFSKKRKRTTLSLLRNILLTKP